MPWRAARSGLGICSDAEVAFVARISRGAQDSWSPRCRFSFRSCLSLCCQEFSVAPVKSSPLGWIAASFLTGVRLPLFRFSVAR